MVGEYHHFSPQGQGCRPWARKLSRLQIARPGHGDSREGYREPPMATSAWASLWKCQKQSACWLQSEWSGSSPGLLPEPHPVHHGSGSHLPRVSYGKICAQRTWSSTLKRWRNLCFRSPAKTPVPCVSGVLVQTQSPVLDVPVGWVV